MAGREILFLAHRLPWPPDRGDKIRSYHILQALMRIAPVHVGAFADDERDLGFAAEMRGHVASDNVPMHPGNRIGRALGGLLRGQPLSVAMFRHRSMRHYVERIMAERPIGCVFAFSGQMAQYLPRHGPSRTGADCLTIMDFVDMDSEKFRSYATGERWPMRAVHAREGRMLAAFERKAAGRADISLFVSEAEAGLFRRAAGLGSDRVRALENGIDTMAFDPLGAFDPVRPRGAADGPLILFTGQMDYRPNIDAVTSFAREAMPRIRAHHPDAFFAIVGRNPTPAVRALESEAVGVTGAVPDVRPWLAAADVVVAPLRIARGVQNKVLEAMAMAKPVVLSPGAAEGIDAQDGCAFHIAHSPAEEAQAVIDLLAHPARAAAMGAAARSRMVERYAWSATLAPLHDLVAGAIG